MTNFALETARAQAPIAVAPFHEWAFPDGTVWTQFYRAGEGYLLRFPGLADFEVSADGRDVVCRPGPGIADGTPEHLYRNQVLPLVLSRLGKLVFHASAVEIGDGAVAFIAESGRGKSTLAACFAMAGYPVLTDDGLVLEPASDGYRVLPGQASLRLWEDSRQALGVPADGAAPALSFTAKARFPAAAGIGFCAQPRLLRRAYFLGDGSATRVELRRMSATESLVAWTKHSFLLDVEARPSLASHFDRVAKLAAQPVAYRLDFPRRFDELARVRQTLAEHACMQGEAA